MCIYYNYQFSKPVLKNLSIITRRTELQFRSFKDTGLFYPSLRELEALNVVRALLKTDFLKVGVMELKEFKQLPNLSLLSLIIIIM